MNQARQQPGAQWVDDIERKPVEPPEPWARVDDVVALMHPHTLSALSRPMSAFDADDAAAAVGFDDEREGVFAVIDAAIASASGEIDAAIASAGRVRPAHTSAFFRHICVTLARLHLYNRHPEGVDVPPGLTQEAAHCRDVLRRIAAGSLHWGDAAHGLIASAQVHVRSSASVMQRLFNATSAPSPANPGHLNGPFSGRFKP